MSVFNCAVTYKKSKYSRQAVKNQLVAHKFIDEKFNILDLNKFRQANTELSNDASEKLGKKVRLFAEENGGKRALPYEDVFREIDSKALQIQSLIEKAQTTEFDKELATKIQAKLESLYPEIKLNITNNPVWEQGDNVFNQEEYNNQVNYRLKAVDILLSDKAKQVFEKGSKNKWSLDKMLSELQVPKGQKQLIEEVLQTMSYYEEIPFNEQIALALAETFAFTVEINDTGIATKDYYIIDDDGGYIDINKGDRVRKGYYSNLTVPGGTNYAENEIATPAITPSIKGHAQFSTDNGIGWFRSDEQATSFKEENEEEFEDLPFLSDIYVEPIGDKGSKTRRILEVQSDLFQKGRGKEKLVGKKENEDRIAYLESIIDRSNSISYTEEGYPILTKNIEKELTDLREIKNKSQNQFLQLLNKDNNWVTFFIKSIIQDSAKKGYENVRFPLGDTAAKIEGHQTLEEFKKQKEDRIKELERRRNNKLDELETAKLLDSDRRILEREVTNLDSEIITLNKELERVEKEGFGALKPIYNFYENTVANILKKQGYSPTLITDEYGNTWNEIIINQARDLANVLLQRNEANQIIGQANIKAMTVLIDAVNQKQDTLPHEYAHHYIAWFRNTPIVQEAIKKWGSEEALVQSIGEQVVKQKGEAYNWWNNFVRWILNQFNKLSTLQKEELTQILTDAFLTRQDLRSFQNTQNLSKQIYSKQISEKVFSINITSPEQFKQYATQNKDKLLILESTPDMTTISVPGIGPIEGLTLDNIMTIATIGATKQDIKDSFEDLNIELRADGTFDVVFINDDYGSQLKNSNPILYTTLNTLLKNNFNFNNTNTDLIEAAENNDAQLEYQLTIDFSETADVLNNLTCK